MYGARTSVRRPEKICLSYNFNSLMAKYEPPGTAPAVYASRCSIVAVAAAASTCAPPSRSLPPTFPTADPAAPVVGRRCRCWRLRRCLLRRGLRLRRLAEPAYGEEAILAGRAGPAHRGPAAAGRGAPDHAVPGYRAGRSAIAVLNVLLSSLVKRRWPERAGLLVGIYLIALSVGAICPRLLSVPLYRSSGGRCRWRLACGRSRPRGPRCCRCTCSVRTGRLPGCALRAFGAGRRSDAPGERPAIKIVQVRAHLAGHPRSMGLQSLLYYAALSWLPTYLPGPRHVGGHGRQPARADGCRQPRHLAHRARAGHRLPGQRALVVPSLIGTAVGLAGSLWGPLGTAPLLGPGPRRQPGLLPRPGHLLHDGAGPCAAPPPRCPRSRSRSVTWWLASAR